MAAGKASCSAHRNGQNIRASAGGLGNRYGGSAGFDLQTPYGFPFHPLTMPAKGLLDAVTVCPRIISASNLDLSRAAIQMQPVASS